MPIPKVKVEFTLPTGTAVRWPAPTFSEGRQLLQLVDSVAAQTAGAFQELVELVAAIAGPQPELEELVAADAIEVAVSFAMAPRVAAAPTEPTPAPIAPR